MRHDRLCLALGCFLAFSFIATPGHAGEIEGSARVIDGDTLRIDETIIRLRGIRSFETDQTCRTQKERTYNCGERAADVLTKALSGQTVECRWDGDASQRLALATCYVGHANVNVYMVKTGWAFAHGRGASMYADHEAAAEMFHLGAWGGRFIMPWRWEGGERLPEASPPRTNVKNPQSRGATTGVRFDIEAYCEDVSQSTGGSYSVKETCIQGERAAKEWAARQSISSRIHDYCQDTAQAVGGSYTIFQTCVQQERAAR